MRAKTDRIDARKLRKHLEKGEIHDSWIPPRHVLAARGTHRSPQHSRQELPCAGNKHDVVLDAPVSAARLRERHGKQRPQPLDRRRGGIGKRHILMVNTDWGRRTVLASTSARSRTEALGHEHGYRARS